MYKLYAIMRDGRKIMLCEWDNLDFFETILNQFNKGTHIERFYIEKNNVKVKEKVLERGKVK